MSTSFELSIEPAEQSPPYQPDSKIYQPIEEKTDEYFIHVVKLQETLKMQNLLFEYEQKRKNDRIKQIEYHYTNAFSNYLWTKHSQQKKQQFIFLNPKDIITINDEIPNELQTQISSQISLLKRLTSTQKIPFKNDVKPTIPFISDFMNFWPLWHQRIKEIIEIEIESSERIEGCFQSQYTFAAKMLSNLRLNDRIQRFCAGIFEPVLTDLESIHEELIVDFSILYEKWNDQLLKLPILKRFIEGGDPDMKMVKIEIEELFGKLKGDQQAKILIDEMIHFQRKQSPISFLLAEVGEEEIPDHLNLRLAWLIWKKILSNRKKLQNIATSLLSSIVESFASIPHQIKYVVRCFKDCATKKFGELRFEDLKSFFNKVVFSQLFFAQFMSLYENRNQSYANNTNLTLLALISQKIMFGQQFYEKFKFGFLNQVINHYTSTIRQFIKGFVSAEINQSPIKFMENILFSFQSIKFIYEVVKNDVGSLTFINEYVCNVSHHNIAGKSYPLKYIYVFLEERVGTNYNAILKSNNKIKRTFTEFLILIDKISQKNNIKRLLEQYRCLEEDFQGNRPSVQLYAIYLSQLIEEIDWMSMVNEIQLDITNSKRQIQRIKIGLEKQYNYAINLQKMYMKILNKRRSRLSKNKLKYQIDRLLSNKFDFQYDIIEGKVCEGSKSSIKTFRMCLHDICDCFLNKYEGVEGLYHNLCEKVIQELEKGVVPDNMAQNAKSILGEKLYQILKMDSYMSQQDLNAFKQMEKHGFITPQMLDMGNYEAEVQIIVNESQKYINQLYRPICPDRILRIFYQITLIFQNVITATGSGADITADIQIPLMLLTIVRCKIRNIVTLIDFVQKFCPDEINASVLGQTLTLLKSAIYLIIEMDNKKLSLSAEEYSNYIINRSYVIID